jgi:L-asparaginase / beta-aspartyl-peptidase
MTCALYVHGGAGNDYDDRVEQFRTGVMRAAQAGWEILNGMGSAMDAVEAAVKVMEDDPTFDAGIGSFLNKNGEVEMDAFIMDGATLSNGAVAGLQRVNHPVEVARLVMEKTPHCLMIGSGAEALARAHGIPECPVDILVTSSSTFLIPEDMRGMDTVGAIALDANGNIAVANSTGGTAGKMPGRVGDTPLIGCGAYADNRTGAACASGRGESLMKVVFCKTALDYLAAGYGPQAAAEMALAYLEERAPGEAGILVMNKQGQVGSIYNTHHMVRAYIASDSELLILT